MIIDYRANKIYKQYRDCLDNINKGLFTIKKINECIGPNFMYYLNDFKYIE